MRRLSVVAVIALLPAVAQADWNTVSGGNSQRNGRSSALGPSRPTQLWSGGQLSIIGWSGVAAGDLLVTTRAAALDPETSFYIVGQRLGDGMPLWSVQLPWDPANPGWYSHVSAIRDGHVYATRSGGCHRYDYYYALDPANGSILWRSQDRVRECPPESPAFAPNGDLIVGDYEWVTRISRSDGSTIWRIPRLCPSQGGCHVAVFGDRGYIWEFEADQEDVVALDLATGARLYAAQIQGQIVHVVQVGLMVGPDGTVYAPHIMGNVIDRFVAFRDTGTALVEKWRVPVGYAPSSTFTVGRDGSVYTVTTDGRLARLHPDTGALLGTSMPINTTDIVYQIQIALDRQGTLYVTDGEDMLYSFNPDLSLRWSEFVREVSQSPPILASNGILVVGASGTDVRAYRARLLPVALAADTSGNGVLEPGEPAVVAPTWRNQDAVAATFFGNASGFTGPPGGTYELTDATTLYGTVGPGTNASCAATGDCLVVRVSAPTRPAAHWDATLRETLNDAEDVTWTLHVGDSFTDVPRTSGFYRFVETVLHHQVAGGCASGLYCPAASTSREQMAVFVLAAAEGNAYVPRACVPGAGAFLDVPASSPFCRWVEELARRAISSGCGGGNYCPTAPVARDQMAVFTLLAREAPGYRPPACVAGQERFADVPASSPFCPWVEELARRGVVSGCGGGNYCPQQPVTREQMAVFVSRTFELQLYGP